MELPIFTSKINHMDEEHEQPPESRKCSESSDTNDRLLVSSLYDDDHHQRKSSISFDKIKQSSLTYSLQGDEESSPPNGQPEADRMDSLKRTYPAQGVYSDATNGFGHLDQVDVNYDRPSDWLAANNPSNGHQGSDKELQQSRYFTSAQAEPLSWSSDWSGGRFNCNSDADWPASSGGVFRASNLQGSSPSSGGHQRSLASGGCCRSGAERQGGACVGLEIRQNNRCVDAISLTLNQETEANIVINDDGNVNLDGDCNEHSELATVGACTGRVNGKWKRELDQLELDIDASDQVVESMHSAPDTHNKSFNPVGWNQERSSRNFNANYQNTIPNACGLKFGGNELAWSIEHPIEDSRREQRDKNCGPTNDNSQLNARPVIICSQSPPTMLASSTGRNPFTLSGIASGANNGINLASTRAPSEPNCRLELSQTSGNEQLGFDQQAGFIRPPWCQDNQETWTETSVFAAGNRSACIPIQQPPDDGAPQLASNQRPKSPSNANVSYGPQCKQGTRVNSATQMLIEETAVGGRRMSTGQTDWTNINLTGIEGGQTRTSMARFQQPQWRPSTPSYTDLLSSYPANQKQQQQQFRSESSLPVAPIYATPVRRPHRRRIDIVISTANQRQIESANYQRDFRPMQDVFAQQQQQQQQKFNSHGSQQSWRQTNYERPILQETVPMIKTEVGCKEASVSAVEQPSQKRSEETAAPEPQVAKQEPQTSCPLDRRPIKLKNLITGEQTTDLLSKRGSSQGCDRARCLGSLMNPDKLEAKVRSLEETMKQAREFINDFYASIKRLDSPAHKQRLAEVEEQLRKTETYYLKETELIYGAKLAWRNAARCIGRIQWSKLQVFDARFTTTASEMFEAICNHIKYSTNKGSLRSAITILPPRTKSVANDWRIWNNQLIGYACYEDKTTGKLIGDPANLEITKVAIKLGWKGKGTKFDVLPLILTAAGQAPQMFNLPDELVLRVKIKHPKYNWFEELGLEWYALPAVANMMLDVGGLQFTAAPFSGWYMVTEIGTRDLGDTNRYNMLEEVAQRMGLNTTSNASLWRDQAVLQLNLAVLDSFQQAGVTIVDHHTAAETFMTHLANEQRLRGGCPADWVWLVPPTAGSTTPVFHQEMVNYHLRPNYEYMQPMWKSYDWAAWEQAQAIKDQNNNAKLNESKIMVNNEKLLTPSSKLTNGIHSPSRMIVGSNGELTPRKLRFKEIARAVKFTSKLYGKALSRRIKANILYATETGKSERFANKLAKIFSSAFNVHLMSMSDYDMTCLEHEALLLVVTSTFGNGDPPENGELFSKHLAAVKITGDTSPDIESINSVNTNPFFQMMSEDHKEAAIQGGQLERDGDDDFSPAPKMEQQTQQVRPLSNVRFGVFALGSTAYPHYCAFGRYVDQILGELGAERILKCTCGDELCGQEKAFNEWSQQVFKTACDVFCLTDSLGPIDDRPEQVWAPADVRFLPVQLIANQEPMSSQRMVVRNLVSITNKKIIPFSVKNRQDLHHYDYEEGLQTIRVDLESDKVTLAPLNRRQLAASFATTNDTSIGSTFEAGDHIAIYPLNKSDMVEKLLQRCKRDLPFKLQQFDFDQLHTILVRRENMDLTPVVGGAGSPPSSSSSPNSNIDKSAQNGSGGTATNGSHDNGWIPHDRLPMTSVREALTRYLDITSPPNQEFLLILSRQTSDVEQKKRLQQLGRNFTIYEEWKNKQMPNLLSLLEEFDTVKFEPALIAQLPILKPRYYSVSGISISMTVGVVRYKSLAGEQREGLCSTYLNEISLDSNTRVYGYVRSAPAFHMAQNRSLPLILIGAGTGLAPFRSFWQQRRADMLDPQLGRSCQFGRIKLYFGCRNSAYVLYEDELEEMQSLGVLDSVRIAFSRQPGQKKTYVQDRLATDGDEIYQLIMHEGAHVYVCGDVAMADGVYKTLCQIIGLRQQKQLAQSNKSAPSSAGDSGLGAELGGAAAAIASQQQQRLIEDADGETIMMNLRNLNRYHEDIFGAKQAS